MLQTCTLTEQHAATGTGGGGRGGGGRRGRRRGKRKEGGRRRRRRSRKIGLHWTVSLFTGVTASLSDYSLLG